MQLIRSEYGTSAGEAAVIMKGLNKTRDEIIEVLRTVYNCSDSKIAKILQDIGM